MRRKLFNLLLVLFCCISTITAQNLLVPDGSNWQYYAAGNAPANIGGNTWTAINYDASAWSNGMAQLGYGDGDESTVISSTSRTAYFRHAFTIEDAAIYADLDIGITYDDGAVVYLNGVEIWRVNMPAGAITYTTNASSTSSDNAFATNNFTSSLVDGVNVLSVEIHQVSSTSSDLTFDCSLSANLSAGESNYIVFGDNWSYYASTNSPADNNGSNWKGLAYNSSSWSTGNSQLGYGDGDEATVVNAASEVAYFRKSFTVTDASLYSTLDLNLIYDDGAVVYLNGNEVWRVNMPAGNVTYATWASSVSAENAAAAINIANSLVSGTNVIAVEVHQESAGSSDISFNFSLKANVSSGSNDIVPFAESWKYYAAGNTPANQSSLTWISPTYNDVSWSAGNGQLGYGDGDEATTLSNTSMTCYFRKSFNVVDAAQYSNLNFNLIFDDGAIVYLNGVEIWRVNMPAGVVDYNTLAASLATDNQLATNNFINNLVEGTNVLAVEVHQESATSSDISFDLQLRGTYPGQVEIVRGPYLQTGTPTSVIVKWRTDVPTESLVEYGTVLGTLNQSVSDLNPKTEHQLLLSGLTPNTVYYYQVGNSTQTLYTSAADVYYKTAPPVGTRQPITAWVLGDAGTANSNQRAVRNAYYNYIGANHTDMMLFLGDNAYESGTDNEYQFAMFENMYESKLKNTVAWSCLGNHDGYSTNSASQTGPYYDIFTFPTNGEAGGEPSGTEAYYSFDYGNIHFIVLESYQTSRSVGSPMYNWCLNDIQNTMQEWIVVLFHHPPYTKGSHNSDTETELVQMRQNFLPMLESNGVDLVLNGHSHSYERTYFLNGHYGTSGTYNSVTHTVGDNGDGNGRVDGAGAYEKTSTGPEAGEGAVYVVTGSAGKIGGVAQHNAMYTWLNELGSTVLEVDGNIMNVKFINQTGTVRDYFTIQKETLDCGGGNQVNDPCNDGNACTINDVYDANCNCIGTFEDTDSDGVCDANDQCPGQNDALIGTACNDGNACTTNDVYDANCGCAGTFADADSDGVCDANDQCPGLNDALIGTACNDGDACTINDTYDANCGCSGTLRDADSDGICDDFDQCPGLSDALIGTACNDGNACTTNDIYDNNCNCSGSFADSDSDGVCDGLDQCPGQNDALIGTACNDGNACTINDFYDSSCGCVGTFQDTDSDGVCDANDQCPGQNDAIIGTACNDGNPCTINDLYDSNCGCSGTFSDTDSDGVCDGLDQCPGQNDALIGTACNDGNACTINDIYDNNCGCVGTFQDTDGDGVCNANDQCPGQNDAIIGTACNDGNACTVNDIYNSSCNCGGTFQDSDGDGVCDANDLCPGEDDTIDTNTNGIPDACEGCTYVTVNTNNFNSSWGIWTDGGTDCVRGSYPTFANSGTICVQLRDNTTSSVTSTGNLNLTAYSEIRVDFSFMANSMENGEDFWLQVSTNGGSTYTTKQTWRAGTEFSNNQRVNPSVTIAGPFTSNTRIRFRNDASDDNDLVYIDDVTILGCNNNARVVNQPETPIEVNFDDKELIDLDKKLILFPNPATNHLNLVTNLKVKTVSIFNVNGVLVNEFEVNEIDSSIDISKLSQGSYFVVVQTDNEMLYRKFIKL
jgi:hypothetical protein